MGSVDLLEGMPRLKFRGEVFLLVNKDNTRTDGAIATEDEYLSFALNRYCLCEDGTIRSYGRVVGDVTEIEWLPEVTHG